MIKYLWINNKNNMLKQLMQLIYIIWFGLSDHIYYLKNIKNFIS